MIIFGRLVFDRSELWKLIYRVLERHPETSAIAVMESQHAPRFVVCHNPRVTAVPTLSRKVFDGDSFQMETPNAPSQTHIPPMPAGLGARLWENAKRSQGRTITVKDYLALKQKKGM